MAKDLVCGMSVDEEKAEHKLDYKGKTYYFCAAGCKEAFEKDPEGYISVEEGSAETGEEKKWWQIWK